MKALITGASSGIGRDMARYLSAMGWELILTSTERSRAALTDLASELDTNCEIFCCDLSEKDGAFGLYKYCRGKSIDMLVNNAGFGLLGEFDKTSLKKELDMINVNVRSLHILTKLFLKKFKQQNRGTILNVASTAGLLPAGPMMAAYYATKAYVKSLTLAVNEELKQAGSNVWICALCPGPVDTEFNEVADASFSVSGISAEYCAKYAVREMLAKQQLLIIPGKAIRAGVVASKVIPTRLYLKAANSFQTKKVK